MTIPASVTNIEWTGPGYFSHKTSGYWNAPMPLKSIVVDKNNKVYASFDGVLYTKDKKKLIYYPPYKKDTSYIIPSFVTYIGSFAFYCCKYLTELTIPDNVLRIKVGAVQANLTKLTISNPNLNVEKGAFQYLDTEKCEIKIPSELYDTFYKPLWDSEGSFAICNVP